jgi:hypothetical protein
MSDVNFSFAKNSELIFTFGGRYLCSSINPTKESQQWVASQQERWKDSDAIIVLGLGCGYHVRALRSISHADVVAVETNRTMISAASRVHPLDLKESDVVHFESESDLASSPALVRATQKSYTVLLHDPSVFLRRDLFLAARRFLLGRNQDGLKWLFKNRNIPANSDFQAEGALSLKHLDSLLPQDRLVSAPILNAVRELIA